MPRIMSIDSSIIAIRSSSRSLNISKSGGVAPGPMPNMKRPFDMWSNWATWPATIAGCWYGRQMTPVQSLIRSVSGMRAAISMSGDWMGSEGRAKCSPSHTSSNPTASAQRMTSMSSLRRVWYPRR